MIFTSARSQRGKVPKSYDILGTIHTYCPLGGSGTYHKNELPIYLPPPQAFCGQFSFWQLARHR